MPIAAVMIVVAYLAALSGQALGADQMHVLRDVVDECLGDSVAQPESAALDVVAANARLDLAS